MSSFRDLLSKYDVPAPRYTSYPTVPYWEKAPEASDWIQHIQHSLSSDSSSWSLYLHIPFCETLCTFCGCNTIITKDHKKEIPYTEVLLKEWELYLSKVPQLKTKPLKHLHLGGGTPTFLTAENLQTLLKPIMDQTVKSKDFEASIEVDPRRTSKEQLKVLKDLGFNRVSLGVQDFEHEVQRLVNRIQPFEITKGITDAARELGFSSVNFDLIYGLAKQTAETMKKTVDLTIQLRPDRIALYSFALVPWIKPAQRLFKDEDLPKTSEKRELYEIARQKLIQAGYVEVGMDHFALPTDSLAKALKTRSLHRNFMGYTDQKTDLLLGLGVSSISETAESFHQNEKVMALYEQKINQGQIATHRGHCLTSEDQARREQILKLMTEYEVAWADASQKQQAIEFLSEMISDGLVKITDEKLVMTETGKPFLRNACVFFDERLKRNKPGTQIFSRSI